MLNIKHHRKPILLSGFLIFVLFSSFSVLGLAQEVKDEREFDYLRDSEKGPAHWGDLKQEWAACKNGEMQSPIDMSNQRVKIIRKSGELQRTYKPNHVTLKNRGHDISRAEALEMAKRGRRSPYICRKGD